MSVTPTLVVVVRLLSPGVRSTSEEVECGSVTIIMMIYQKHLDDARTAITCRSGLDTGPELPVQKYYIDDQEYYCNNIQYIDIYFSTNHA
jgi:hypothetical protein